MESVNSSSSQSSNSVETEEAISETSSEQWFTEQFDNLLPKIQERWPDLAKQTLEATKGSLDDLINVISTQSGKNNFGVINVLSPKFHKNFSSSLLTNIAIRILIVLNVIGNSLTNHGRRNLINVFCF